MGNRIQGQPAHAGRGRITQQIGAIAMRKLVQDDRHQDRQYPNGQLLHHARDIHCFQSIDSIFPTQGVRQRKKRGRLQPTCPIQSVVEQVKVVEPDGCCALAIGDGDGLGKDERDHLLRASAMRAERYVS